LDLFWVFCIIFGRIWAIQGLNLGKIGGKSIQAQVFGGLGIKTSNRRTGVDQCSGGLVLKTQVC